MNRRRSTYKPHWSARIPLENAGEVERRAPVTRYTQELIEETKEVWQPYYANELSDEEACEIIENMSMFVGALLGVRREYPNRGEPSRGSD